MEQNQVARRREELVALAESILAGEKDLIEGIRQICALRFAIGDPDNEVFLPIRAIESDTDFFPAGHVRAQYDPERLKSIDQEMGAYMAAARDDVLRACVKIVQTYSDEDKSRGS